MPKLKPTLMQRVKLVLPVEDDPNGEAYAIYRPATQRDVERIARLQSTQSRIYRQGLTEMEVKGSPLMVEQERLQVYLTLVECNYENADGSPVFTFGNDQNGNPRLLMTEEAFQEAWGTLYESWAEALHKGCLEVNPQWDPNFQRK